MTPILPPRNKNNYISFALILVLFVLYPNIGKAPNNHNALEPQVLGAQTLTPLGEPQQEPVTAPAVSGTLDFGAVQAKSFLVYDTASGAVLAEKNSAQPMAIASLTKLMTALVVYEEAANFRDPVTISNKDTFTVQPVLGLKIGDTVTVGDLFNAMLVGSANDAAVTLSNYIETKSGSHFVDLMNRKAESLAMSGTHFSNPLGFDSEANYSTARDLQKLVIATQKYQAFSLIGRNQKYSFSGTAGKQYTVKTTNTLLAGNEHILAIKTGYTELAQGAMITEIKNQSSSFIIIVLDSANRENDTTLLQQQISKNYVWTE